MNYFDHPYVSNSDLKNFKKKIGMAPEDPLNLQAIFDFGSLFHATILEPHLTNKDDMSDDAVLARKMKDTFFKDELCRSFVMAPDFKREEEFYNQVEVDGMRFNSRCKADGVRTGLKVFLEIKGLGIDSEKAFKEALTRFDYDQGIAHYMLTSKCDMAIIVGISKRKPERMFKKIVKKHDEFYAWGEEKLIQVLRLLHTYSPEDIQLVA